MAKPLNFPRIAPGLGERADGRPLALGPAFQDAEAAVTTRNYDDWTTDRWKVEPKFPWLDIDEPAVTDRAPSLWNDLALASVVALALWVVAVLLFR
jgi:hypothetical protein